MWHIQKASESLCVCFVIGGTGGDLTDGKKYLAIMYKLRTIVSTVSFKVKI